MKRKKVKKWTGLPIEWQVDRARDYMSAQLGITPRTMSPDKYNKFLLSIVKMRMNYGG